MHELLVNNRLSLYRLHALPRTLYLGNSVVRVAYLWDGLSLIPLHKLVHDYNGAIQPFQMTVEQITT